jgi:hypothetical protein
MNVSAQARDALLSELQEENERRRAELNAEVELSTELARKLEYDRARLAEAETLLREVRLYLDDAGSGPEWNAVLSRFDAFLTGNRS